MLFHPLLENIIWTAAPGYPLANEPGEVNCYLVTAF